MSQPSFVRSVIIVLAACAISACAGIHQYTTGVPAKDSERFFPSLQSAAEQRGHQTWRGRDGALAIDVGTEGRLMYSVRQGVIVVSTYPSSGGSDADKETRAQLLREEHETLIQVARSDARDNRAFSD